MILLWLVETGIYFQLPVEIQILKVHKVFANKYNKLINVKVTLFTFNFTSYASLVSFNTRFCTLHLSSHWIKVCSSSPILDLAVSKAAAFESNC